METIRRLKCGAHWTIWKAPTRASGSKRRRSWAHFAEDVRLEAVRALGKIKEPGAIKVLGDVLAAGDLSPSLGMILGTRVPSTELRKECVVALRQIRTDRALPLLKNALEKDSAPTVRSAAGEAFLDVGRQAAVTEALPFLADRDPFVRMMLIEGLGDLGDERAVDVIGACL